MNEQFDLQKDFAIATFANIDTSGNKNKPDPISEQISMKLTVVLSICAVNSGGSKFGIPGGTLSER